MDDSGGNHTKPVLTLVAGHKTSGEPVFEEVVTEALPDGGHRLLHTPGLVLGVAAGDVIEPRGDGTEFTIRSRGGNLAVQVHGPPDVALSIEPDIRGLGGWHDGGVKDLTIYTVPVRAGFSRLESVLDSLVAREPAMEWYYGNVYDDDGETQLFWWKDLA
jgi:hypothetical protein